MAAWPSRTGPTEIDREAESSKSTNVVGFAGCEPPPWHKATLPCEQSFEGTSRSLE